MSKSRRDGPRSAPQPAYRMPRASPKIIGGAGAVALVVLLLGLAVRGLPLSLAQPSATAAHGKTAAIVDQVALSYPNPEFTDQALASLTAAGFDVDVYTGPQVTVEFLRTLPLRGYQLIVFRTHSTNDFRGPAPAGKPVYLYTGEPHDRYRYFSEQLSGQIMAGRVRAEESAPALFIVGPGFVRQSMQGRFENSLLIIGGCDSLSTDELAEALLERGAGAIVGWNGLVDAAHNDKALLHLLRLLMTEGLPLDAAVRRTRLEVGPDPTFQSVPIYFPLRRGTADNDSPGWGRDRDLRRLFGTPLLVQAPAPRSRSTSLRRMLLQRCPLGLLSLFST